MNLYEIELSTNACIYVIAANESNAAYKAYNKAAAKVGKNPSNESYSSWVLKILNVKWLYSINADESKFNLY